MAREDRWSESIAGGSDGFVEHANLELDLNAHQRQIAVADGGYTLLEPAPAYSDHFDMENEALRPNNAVP